jgi:hypothetical protein
MLQTALLAGFALLPLAGFLINADKKKEDRGNKKITDDTLGTQGKVQFRINENRTENRTDNENEKIIFNEIGQILNDTYSMEKGKEFTESTIFKNIGGSSDRPFVTASLRETDENGLSKNFGSYKDNFPYDPNQSRKINMESYLKDNNFVNKFKKQSNLSSIILPKGVDDYLEIYDVNQKIKKISEEVFPVDKNRLTLSAPEALVQRHQYSISLADSVPLNLSDSRLEENLEIKFS